MLMGLGGWVTTEHARTEDNTERLSVCRMRTELDACMHLVEKFLSASMHKDL